MNPSHLAKLRMLPLITPGARMTNDDTDSDQFLSFAKRSRTVWRSYEMETAFTPAPCWRRYAPVHDLSDLSQRPGVQHFPHNFLVTENYMDASAGMAGCAVSSKPLSGQRLPQAPEKLPTPRELMGQRRRGGRREGVGGSTAGDVAQHKAEAVLQHIRDLKKRQSAIDKLKTEKWWSSTSCQDSQEDSWGAVEGCPLSPMTKSALQAGGTAPPHSDSHGSCDQEVTFGTQLEKQDLAPGGNPMMSFVMTTADKQDHHSRNIPFWRRFGGTSYNIEQ
ncbi:uncharacterized protein LOC125721664 [Brienomyrus brachyistius]|uniref:uncharacterized protein LOC125721664 n=1 Tax=Brienomyrus brachyistius TaxID=42636 RepID=UPI0020B27EC3|nr:uncharacterized protein LOC125721664 [Brienomyrus brachyistius]